MNRKEFYEAFNKLTEKPKNVLMGTRLEREGTEALQQFDFAELDALLSAMKAGQELNAMVKNGRSLADYPATSPMLALQTILDNIREQNQFEGHGHHHTISNVAFSLDGKRLVTTGDDGTARLWNLQGQQLAVLKGNQDDVNIVRFSPDGEGLVTLERRFSRSH